MTKKEKQLLLQDLCCRLPYGVKCHYKYYDFVGEMEQLTSEDDAIITGVNTTLGNPIQVDGYYVEVEYVKPYLRPMSSMTEKEKKELWTAIYKDMSIIESNFDAPIINEYEGKVYRGNPIHYELDFLISHHFDYLDLIPKGLALEAPKGMYKFY